MEALVLAFPRRRFTWGGGRIKTGRRKISSTKQFTKVKVRSQGGREADSSRRNWPLGCFGIGYYWVSLGLEELGLTVGWSLMGLPTGWEVEVLALQGLYQNHHGSLSPSGRAVPAMRMHDNEPI